MTVRRGPIARAVASALRAAPPIPRDRGAVELAKSYAALIDDAAAPERYRQDLATVRAGIDPGNDKAREAFMRIAAAVSAHTVASDLGPKLLAALAALHMTAAARGKVENGKPRDPVAQHLDELRARRDRRGAGQHDPEAVDAPAP